MNIKKLNEELQKFIVNEISSETATKVIQKRQDQLNKAKRGLTHATDHLNNKGITAEDVIRLAGCLPRTQSGEVCPSSWDNNRNLISLQGLPTKLDKLDLTFNFLPRLQTIGDTLKYVDHLQLEFASKDFNVENLNNLQVDKLDVYGWKGAKLDVTQLPKYNYIYIFSPDVKITGLTTVDYYYLTNECDLHDIKHVKGDVGIYQDFKDFKKLTSLRIDGNINISCSDFTTSGYKLLYKRLTALGLWDKVVCEKKQEIEDFAMDRLKQPQPHMQEYTREDGETFKIGDIVTCPSPGKFEIIDIYYAGTSVWKNKLHGSNGDPDTTHAAELKNIKTKTKTAFSMYNLEKSQL